MAKAQKTTLIAEEAGAPYSTRASSGLLLGDAASAALRAALSTACSEADLAPDGRLAELALRVAVQSEQGRKAPSAAQVSYYARRLGLVDPTPQLWLASAEPVTRVFDALHAAVVEAKAREALTHCGGAAVRAENATVVVVALSRRLVSFQEDIARTVALGAPLHLKGKLARAYDGAVLVVTPPRGDVQRMALPRGRSFQHTLPLTQRGAHMVEVLAEGPEGLTVVAIFPIAVGEAEERAPPFAAQKVERSAEEVRTALVRLIAEERKRRSLTPLTLHPTLNQVAAAHSRDMHTHHFIAHTSKTTGEASDRVDRAGFEVSILLENIGRGYNASDIHAGLMESPGHRANILHPDVHLVGIGVVAENEGTRQAFLVTELFAAPMASPKKPSSRRK